MIMNFEKLRAEIENDYRPNLDYSCRFLILELREHSHIAHIQIEQSHLYYKSARNPIEFLVH